MKFKFIAGTPGLDFVNTVGARIEDGAGYRILRDKLAAFEDVVAWCEAAGLIAKPDLRAVTRTSDQSADAFRRAVAFREALYRIVRACTGGGTPARGDIEILNVERRAAHAHRRLTFSKSRFVEAWDPPDAPDRLLWSIVLPSAAFLVSESISLIRQCPGEECGWMFLDTSRNHTRQWCEMRICGNRAKARRFRERSGRQPI